MMHALPPMATRTYESEPLHATLSPQADPRRFTLTPDQFATPFQLNVTGDLFPTAPQITGEPERLDGQLRAFCEARYRFEASQGGNSNVLTQPMLIVQLEFRMTPAVRDQWLEQRRQWEATHPHQVLTFEEACRELRRLFLLPATSARAHFAMDGPQPTTQGDARTRQTNWDAWVAQRLAFHHPCPAETIYHMGLLHLAQSEQIQFFAFLELHFQNTLSNAALRMVEAELAEGWQRDPILCYGGKRGQIFTDRTQQLRAFFRALQSAGPVLAAPAPSPPAPRPARVNAVLAGPSGAGAAPAPAPAAAAAPAPGQGRVRRMPEYWANDYNRNRAEFLRRKSMGSCFACTVQQHEEQLVNGVSPFHTDCRFHGTNAAPGQPRVAGLDPRP